MKIQHHPLSIEEAKRIDAIRGFLCFFIFLFHFYYIYLTNYPTGHLFHRLFIEGYVAVKIFFALSGFLILHSYAKIVTHFLSENVWKIFFIKRIFRTLPAWFAALLIYSIYRGNVSFGEFWWNFFFLFAFQPFQFSNLIAQHSWSLFVEELFYLVFPLLIFLMNRNALLIGLFVFFLAGVVFNSVFPIPTGFFYFTPFNTFGFFGYGLLIYIFYPQFKSATPQALILLLIGLVLLFTSILHAQKNIYILLYIFFWFFYISSNTSILTKIFNFFFSKFGKICYSFYLVHPICIWHSRSVLVSIDRAIADSGYWSLAALFIIGYLLSLGSAILLYFAIELPFIRLGQKLTNKFVLH